MDDRLYELLAINRAITGSLDREEILDLVVGKAAQLTGADACALLLADAGDTIVAAHRGLDDARAASFRAPFDERINAALRDLFGYESEHGFLAVPVVRSGSVQGLLAIHGQRQTWDDPELRLILAALADQAAIALEHASRYREMWEESQQARAALEKASRRKDEFLAMLAHELRNPLAAIVNAIEVMQLRATEDAQLDSVRQVASRQARHMKRLLDDLLDVARVTQGRIRLDRRRVNLNDIVRQSLDATRPVIEEQRHQVQIQLPDAPIHVDGDADRLIQVLSNLLTNAAKYTPPGGHIRVLARQADGVAEIRVRDDGHGIPEELRESLFDLFVQSPQAPHRPAGGLGIGLTLVQQLVAMHAGTVEARSPAGERGSEFVVRLPVTGKAASPVTETAAAGPRARQRILLVEDNADAADMLAIALAAEGHEVQVARHGEAALAAAADELPDAILVDLGLPDMDGLTLVRRIRGLPHGTQPLIVTVSGYGDAVRRRKSDEAGVDHFLVKPVSAKHLSELLRGAPGSR